MPRKYDKYMRPVNGLKADPERQKVVAETFREAKQLRDDRRRRRMFLAEKEELATLDAIERLPESVRLDAAEAALIARVARRKGIVGKRK